MATLRNLLNRLLSPLGYEARPKQAAPDAFSMEAVVRRLRDRGVEFQTVIDVGAAAGRWTRKYLPLFPQANFLMLEPLEERRASLEALRVAHPPRVQYTIAAAGERPGSAVLSVAEDLDGSGIYQRESDARAREVAVTTIDVELARTQFAGPYFLKLDTHGFELPILAGAVGMLPRTNAIIVEVYNFKASPPCLRFHEMCAHLETLGFRCADLADPMVRPGDQLLWQMDLLFLRADSPFFQRTTYQPTAPAA